MPGGPGKPAGRLTSALPKPETHATAIIPLVKGA
jgi:hypothetical protein